MTKYKMRRRKNERHKETDGEKSEHRLLHVYSDGGQYNRYSYKYQYTIISNSRRPRRTRVLERARDINSAENAFFFFVCVGLRRGVGDSHASIYINKYDIHSRYQRCYIHLRISKCNSRQRKRKKKYIACKNDQNNNII